LNNRQDAELITSLYISADFEGACGVASPVQCDPRLDEHAYALALEQLCREIRVVTDVAFSMGVTRILLNDSHATMTNLKLHQVDERVELLTGKPKQCSMLAGLDHSFSAVMLLGYHARAGTLRGVLNHTFHDRIYDVSLNGVSYGEGGLNALYASLVKQCPVILTSGDHAYCQEIQGVIPGLTTVETKQGISFAAAQCYPWQTVEVRFREAVKSVLSAPQYWQNNLLALSPPYTLLITFTTTLDADWAGILPWVERVDGRTVKLVHNDFATVYRAIQACYSTLPKG
jgi:D-amino peptidase